MSWVDEMEKSTVYVAICDQSYFESAECFAQVEYARDLKKPFRIAVERGVDIPVGFFDGVDDIKVEYYETTPTGIDDVMKKLLGDVYHQNMIGKGNIVSHGRNQTVLSIPLDGVANGAPRILPDHPGMNAVRKHTKDMLSNVVGPGMAAGWYLQRDNFESWIELEARSNTNGDNHEIIGNIHEGVISGT